MQTKKIGVIGVGRMGQALLDGLIPHLYAETDCVVFDIDQAKLTTAKAKGIAVASAAQEVMAAAEIVLLAVKPQVMDTVLETIKADVKETQTIISIAAGVTLAHLSKSLKTKKIFRVMPNNPSLVGKGIAAISSLSAAAADKDCVIKIFKSVGEVVEVEEKFMDAVTGLSGSGPAFVYLFIKGLIDAGQELGLTAPVARALALKTVAGSVAVLEKTKKDPTELIDMVKSPGGTTMEGLKVLEKAKVLEKVKRAVKAAAEKSKKLSR